MIGRPLDRVLLAVALALCLPMSAAAQEVVEYYGTDAIGSVRIVFDVNGNIVGRMDYGPFGEQVTVSTVGHKSYAGLFRDGEAGLDYAEARSYQVRTGRFNAPDPVYAGLFQPQAWNRYAYALNNPLTFVDPTGLTAEQMTCKEDPEFGVVCSTSVSVTAGERSRTAERWTTVDAWSTSAFGTVFELDWLDATKQLFSDVLDALTLSTVAGAPGDLESVNSDTAQSTGMLGTVAATVLTAVVSKRLSFGSANQPRAVIGKMADLKSVRPGERSLVDRLPNMGSPKANWTQNSSILRQEMSRGVPIRDASVDGAGNLVNNTGFLRAERNLLRNGGWTYNPPTGMWYPPRP